MFLILLKLHVQVEEVQKIITTILQRRVFQFYKNRKVIKIYF